MSLACFLQSVVVFVSCVHLPTTTKVVVPWRFEKSYYSLHLKVNVIVSVFILQIMQVRDI